MADTTVCSSGSPPKSSDHKATIRKSNKPLMEKKRRARINSCLTQLKSLVLQALKKDTSQFSKLEKADILEMTVKHLKSVQQQHMSVAMATDPNVLTKYRAGFNECAGEVMRYLGSVNGLTDDTRTRVLNHLAMCMQSVNTAASVSLANQAAAVANQNPLGSHMGSCGIPTSLFPAFSSPPHQPQSAHVPPVSALTVPVPSGNATLATLNGATHRIPQSAGDIKPQTSCSSSLQLIPGTLPSGQLAFFVASPATIQTPIQAIPVYTAPSSDPPTPVSSPEVSPRVNAPDNGSATISHGHILSPAAKSDSQDHFFDSKSPTHQHSRLVQFYQVPSATETSRHVSSPNYSPPSPSRESPSRESPSRESPFSKDHPNRSTSRENDSERDTPQNPNDLHDENEEKVWRPW